MDEGGAGGSNFWVTRFSRKRQVGTRRMVSIPAGDQGVGSEIEGGARFQDLDLRQRFRVPCLIMMFRRIKIRSTYSMK